MPTTTPAPELDEGALPCPLALIAANVALMSAYAHPDIAPDDEGTARRGSLARKVVSNLYFLSQHPALPAALRQVMAQAHHHWVQVAKADRQPFEQMAAVPAQATTPTAWPGNAAAAIATRH